MCGSVFDAMTTKRIRVPEDDFTFWVDRDGLPLYRGVETQDQAEKKVMEIQATCALWLELVGHPRETTAEDMDLQAAITCLSPGDQSTFNQLRDVAQRLNGMQGGVRLDPPNICHSLHAITGISASPTVQQLLKRWAALQLA
jgi:hypothetical protein